MLAISSDEEDETTRPAAAVTSDDDAPVQPTKRASGKLQPVNRPKRVQAPISTPVTQDARSQKSPAKPRTTTKVKDKTAEKEPPRTQSKPIQSFFNAAASRQRQSQPSASPEKAASQDEPEAIHDDSGDGGAAVAMCKGSSVALAMRKRKLQHSLSTEDDSKPPPTASQKFRKTSAEPRTLPFSVVNDDKRPWVVQFAPVDLSELAVHKRKVDDVRQWLESTVSGRRQKVLVLKGAAGTGKTTTIDLLARDMNFRVSEWRNPDAVDTSLDNGQSTASQFEDFVRRAGHSAGLTLSTSAEPYDETVMTQPAETPHSSDGNKQLLLIEEFPNTFSRTSTTLQSFRSTILQYVSASAMVAGNATPIVMVISETLLSTNTAAADSFTAHRLLGPELANHPFVDMIEFNAIAPTILRKALDTIVVKEARKSGRRKAPGPPVLKRLAETGDVRSAISSLEFLCLIGDDGDTWSSKIAFSKTKKTKSEPSMTKSEEEALKLICNRESSLGIFHAVGKVVYNKRLDPSAGQELAHPPSWLPQHRRSKLPESDVDVLIDELGTDTSTFIAALHENYALSCYRSSPEEALDSLNGCIDSVSDADLLCVDRFSHGTRVNSGYATDSLRQDEMAFNVAVRGNLFNLPHPVHRSAPPQSNNKGDAHRMFYPASLKMWKAKEVVQSTLEMLMARMQSLENSGFPRPSFTTASSGARGVESWKHTNELDENIRSTKPDAKTETVKLPGMTKTELLLEYLPLVGQIASARARQSPLTALVDHINSVTHIRGQQSLTLGDDGDADEDADTMPTSEPWSTDKPDSDGRHLTHGRAARGQGKQKPLMEAGGLHTLPEEGEMEKLILEDDDIVDD